MLVKSKAKHEWGRKRPAFATPELARTLLANGMTVKQIAGNWGISRAQVYNILKK